MLKALEFLNKLVSLVSAFFQNQRDNELKKDGIRQAENESLKEEINVIKESQEHRKKNNSASDADVLDRL